MNLHHGARARVAATVNLDGVNIVNKKALSIACAGLFGLGLGMSASITPALAAASTAAPSAAAAATAPKLHKAMRSLWHGHIVTTRDYALATFAGDRAKATKAADAVVANAKEIAAAVAGFYGKDAGDSLLELLAGHWAAVQALTDAAKAKNSAAEEKAMTDLGVNAGEIAKFLAGANPNWKESDLQGALVMHGGDHRQQVDLMASKAPQAQQAKAWSEMQKHMDMIADVLASGIAKQFPAKAS